MRLPTTIDLFGANFAAPNTGGLISLNACSESGISCFENYQSAVFQFRPGDTVNFGSIVLTAAALGPFFPSTAADYHLPFLEVTFNAPLTPTPVFGNTTEDPCFNEAFCDISVMKDLQFTLPADATNIQLLFSVPYTYSAPAVLGAVPEPSTWAMLLVGFAGIGFAKYRHQKLNPFAPWILLFSALRADEPIVAA
jgi:PEP-CTERM motif